MVVVVDGQLQHALLVRIVLAEDLLAILGHAIRIALQDCDRLVREADAAFDVVDFRLFRIFEDDHVKPVRILHFEREFRDQDAVPLEDGDVIDLVFAHAVAAIRADGRSDPRAGNHVIGFALDLVARADREVRAALGAEDGLIAAQSVGAIEPVGITKASASNVLNKNASTNATTIDSIVSRVADGRSPLEAGEDLVLAAASWGFAGSEGSPFAFVVVAIVFPDYRMYRIRLKSGMRI